MTKTKPLTVSVSKGVLLNQNDVEEFAEKLRAYLEEKLLGFEVSSVEFRLYEGSAVCRAFVKSENHKDGTATEVFEDVGGPEVRLLVNGFPIATWMIGCDRLSVHTLSKGFEDIAHVSLFALFGTWEFHNEVICCSKWGEEKGSTIECCSTP